MPRQDGHDREIAKWAHQRLDAARRRAGEEQRHALADSTITLRRNPTTRSRG